MEWKLQTEKDKVNFKIYEVTASKANNYNAYIANNSRSKGNQTMKFGQLIENNTRNIFLEKSFYTKCEGETSPRPFSEKSKLSLSLDQ